MSYKINKMRRKYLLECAAQMPKGDLRLRLRLAQSAFQRKLVVAPTSWTRKLDQLSDRRAKLRTGKKRGP